MFYLTNLPAMLGAFQTNVNVLDAKHMMELPSTAYIFRMVILCEDSIKKLTKASSLMNIVVLNLHGNSLTKVKPLQNLPLLKKLILSFNELARLDDIVQLVKVLLFLLCFVFFLSFI
jgi:hypothetical protein